MLAAHVWREQKCWGCGDSETGRAGAETKRRKGQCYLSFVQLAYTSRLIIHDRIALEILTMCAVGNFKEGLKQYLIVIINDHW